MWAKTEKRQKVERQQEDHKRSVRHKVTCARRHNKKQELRNFISSFLSMATTSSQDKPASTLDVAVFWVCGWLGLAFLPRTPFPLLPYRAAAPDRSACEATFMLAMKKTIVFFKREAFQEKGSCGSIEVR